MEAAAYKSPQVPTHHVFWVVGSRPASIKRFAAAKGRHASTTVTSARGIDDRPSAPVCLPGFQNVSSPLASCHVDGVPCTRDGYKSFLQNRSVGGIKLEADIHSLRSLAYTHFC